MKHLNKLATVLCGAALGMLALTGCEGSDIYEIGSPEWISDKVDSISASKSSSSTEEELVGMNEDVYTIGLTDYTSGWWTAFSKYYVIPENTKWNAVFNLNINPSDNTYYKNFALIICNDYDRSDSNYKEYGAIRFDATNDSASYNSQWSSDYYYLPFKFSDSNLMLAPESSADANVQKLGGKVTLTVDRSKVDTFFVKMTNGTVTKTYTQPYALSNLNADETDTNIRCFLVPEGSYLNFLQSNIEPIGGYTSADDKEPVSMVLNNVPKSIDKDCNLDTAMIEAGVTATVTYEEGVTATVDAANLIFLLVPEGTAETGEKTLVVGYNKTFKGEAAAKTIFVQTSIKVLEAIKSLEVTQAPTRTTYYYYTSDATSSLTDRTLAFDTEGLEVTATYADGSTAVVDNSELTFSTVKASTGRKRVTITAVNGVTTTQPITVRESAVTKVSCTPTSLGAEDCSAAWWTVFSDDVAVPAGATYQVDFTNYSSGAGNWNNYVIILRNAALGEYAVVRADNYGWGNGYAAATVGCSGADWAVWLAAMNGAECTAYITNCNNGTCDVQVVMQGTDGTTYVQYYLGINTVDPADLQFSFTCDGSHLVFK